MARGVPVTQLRRAGRQMNREIQTDSAPLPIGPYSQGIGCAGERLIFTAGQIALSPGGSELSGDSIADQAIRALDNVKAILKEAGCGLEQVAKVTVYLKNMDDYLLFNEVYGKYFSVPPYPARSVVEVSRLPKSARVESEAIAVRDGG